jgi:hypothetical protein
MESLRSAGVDVVAITAEPGSEDMIRQRLTERNVPHLDFEVRSDPEHAFLKDPNVPTDIFLMKETEEGVAGPYNMVQPALVVYNADGTIMKECTWSWKTMGCTENDDWDARVDTEAWAGPIQQVMLVTMRPVMSDLLHAIQEKRPVKLASTHTDW